MESLFDGSPIFLRQEYSIAMFARDENVVLCVLKSLDEAIERGPCFGCSESRHAHIVRFSVRECKGIEAQFSPQIFIDSDGPDGDRIIQPHDTLDGLQ